MSDYNQHRIFNGLMINNLPLSITFWKITQNQSQSHLIFCPVFAVGDGREGLVLHWVGKLLTFHIHFSDRLYFLCLSAGRRGQTRGNAGTMSILIYSFPSLTYKVSKSISENQKLPCHLFRSWLASIS